MITILGSTMISDRVVEIRVVRRSMVKGYFVGERVWRIKGKSSCEI